MLNRNDFAPRGSGSARASQADAIPQTTTKNTETMKTEYNHGNRMGISNIWTPDGVNWSWANANGEGSLEPSFEAAVQAAEDAIKHA